MRLAFSFGALGILIISNSASARVVSRGELIRTIQEIKSVNKVIESESDLTKQRCRNQAARKTNVDETLARFSSQATELNQRVTSVTADRAPHLTALNNAKSAIAQKVSEILTIDGRIRNLGRDSDREAELRAEKTAKTNEKNRKVAAQMAGRAQFDAWEARGNNGRILDSAHTKSPADRNANERAAIEYETAFNNADNALTEAIQTLNTRLAAIDNELANLAAADTRTLTQLRADRAAALNAIRENEVIRDREAPLVAVYDRNLRRLQAMIAMVIGIRGAEPINPDCTLLLQTE